MVKYSSTVRIDELSLKIACARRRSPSRVPATECSVKLDKSSWAVKSRTALRLDSSQPVSRTTPKVSTNKKRRVVRLYNSPVYLAGEEPVCRFSRGSF